MEIKNNSNLVNSVAELELAKSRNAIEQFIYSCSHTMRGPLKSIAGLVYLLKNSTEASPFELGYYLHSIENTITKLEIVLNDLEQFLTNSKEDISMCSIDVRELLNEVLLNFQNPLREKGIDISISIKEKASLYTDKSSLAIIMTHLLSNAVMYQDLNRPVRRIGITVKVGLSYCSVRINDNGIGIRDEIKSRIFQLFFRGSEKSSGAGVGLYIVREVLDKMRGTVSVTSLPGRGTCFSFSIPNLSA